MENKAKLSSVPITKSKLFFWSTISFLAIIVFGLIFILYSKGYRLQNNLQIGHMGKLEITLPLNETNIFVDKNKKIQTSKENEIVAIPLSPNKHDIIISRDGYFPWTKKFDVPSGQSVTLHPMFVTQNATGQIITEYDPDYWKIKNLVQTSNTPTKEAPAVSADGKTTIWLENNAIVSKTGDTVHTVIQPDTVIKNLQFYKNRSDVVVFSTYTTVYAIEIDTQNNQNFMPLYRGTDPYFILTDPNYIYVLDGNLLMAVVI